MSGKGNSEPLIALALVCTLKPSPAPSSSQLMAEQILGHLADLGVAGSAVRLADYDVRPGVELDMGDGDEWPQIEEQIRAADILIVATPTWMGQPSSFAQRALERLDAELAESDEQGRLRLLGKVAITAVVGNEDGAQHIYGVLFQALNDVGFTVAGQAATYWNDEVGGEYRNYRDLETVPESVATTNRTVAVHAAHLARLLKQKPFPAV